MVNVSKLAVLFQLLFFCFGIIAFLFVPFLDYLKFPNASVFDAFGNILSLMFITMLFSLPAFFSIYLKLKKDHVSTFWKAIPILTDLIYIFGAIYFSKAVPLLFLLLVILFLLLSSFFGSLSIFQIVRWRSR